MTALARGLDVLSAFRSRDRTLGNQELARRCGLPKSTISRLTYTLTKQGYLEHAQDGNGNPGYRLGSAVLALGSAMLARMDMRQLARPLMQELADSSQAMVSLGIRDRLSMIATTHRNNTFRSFCLGHLKHLVEGTARFKCSRLLKQLVLYIYICAETMTERLGLTGRLTPFPIISALPRSGKWTQKSSFCRSGRPPARTAAP